MRKIMTLLASILVVACSATKSEKKNGTRWTEQQAWEWYNSNDWFLGANFNPSTSINQLEFWQAETFDLPTIERELGWSAEIGMNLHRVYLHDLLWEQDSVGFLNRMEQYLQTADRHGIKTMFVFMDDCWGSVAKLGKQPEPVRHLHNSGWVQSPGAAILGDTTRHDELENYVKGVLTHFKDDKRIAIWDVYNEPGNANGTAYVVESSDKHKYSLALLKKVFKWAREVNPSQPLTSGVWTTDGANWGDTTKLPALDRFMIENSDVITFHDYSADPKVMEQKIVNLKKYGRPIICTEYMARTNNNTFQGCLPIMKRHGVGAINWGLVSGKSNTIFPWESKNKDYFVEGDEPPVWFHDIFRADGTPYDQKEIDFIKSIREQK